LFNNDLANPGVWYDIQLQRANKKKEDSDHIKLH